MTKNILCPGQDSNSQQKNCMVVQSAQNVGVQKEKNVILKMKRL